MREKRKVEKGIFRVRGSRLTIDCSTEQKKKIKMLAAEKEMSITAFVLGLVEEKYTW